MKMIRLATRDDASAVIKLRMAAYESSQDFGLEDSTNTSWDEGDERGFVLGVWSASEKLIGTMRANLINEPLEFRGQVAATAPRALHYPALMLRKAATAEEFRGMSLNSLLRFHIFEAAMAGGIRHVVGNVTTYGTRVRTMLDLGYRLSEEGLDNLSGLQQKAGPWRLAVLDLYEHGHVATEVLRKKCRDLLLQYPWRGQKLTFNK